MKTLRRRTPAVAKKVCVRSDWPACLTELVIVSTIGSGHLEVGVAGKKGQKMRNWSDDETRTVFV